MVKIPAGIAIFQGVFLSWGGNPVAGKLGVGVTGVATTTVTSDKSTAVKPLA